MTRRKINIALTETKKKLRGTSEEPQMIWLRCGYGVAQNKGASSGEALIVSEKWKKWTKVTNLLMKEY